ncbi:hypothetical protein [Helicobacter jaachi]|nr:hypothetical protein [Helicobacter jaachi]
MRFLRGILYSGLISLVSYGFDFAPAGVAPSNNSFGSFSIGGVHTTITNAKMQHYKNERSAVLFGLKRGVMFGESQNVLLNAYIDGRAGSEHKNGLYGISFGAQVGYRLFNGRIIALVGGGLEMNNLAMPQSSEQYNIYGGTARVELFFDIAQGYGISVGYMRGFREKSKKIHAQRFESESIMITLSFYDFSI